MAYLLDTHILFRLVQKSAPNHLIVVQAVAHLRSQNQQLYLCPQNLIEFWNVATRPADVNGLGLSIPQADREVHTLENRFVVLPDLPSIYNEWRQLVVSCTVVGKQVHDALIAATIYVHGITHLLTFNVDDFQRFPNILPVHPKNL